MTLARLLQQENLNRRTPSRSKSVIIFQAHCNCLKVKSQCWAVEESHRSPLTSTSPTAERVDESLCSVWWCLMNSVVACSHLLAPGSLETRKHDPGACAHHKPYFKHLTENPTPVYVCLCVFWVLQGMQSAFSTVPFSLLFSLPALFSLHTCLVSL